MAKDVRHIAFLIIPDATLLDITGPYEVFSQAIEYIQEARPDIKFDYKLHSLSIGKNRDIRTASGIVMRCEENIKSIDYSIDTLIIPGVPNSLIDNYRLPYNVFHWLKEQVGQVRRICSVCTGSFFLAEAGILSNKRATTHWDKCEMLSQRYPDIKVDGNPIFIKDGNVYTSAGISSGMDLALALVEEDYGKSMALEVSKQMVLYLKRPGSQSQYSSILNNQSIDYQPVQDICIWILEHLREHLTVEGLADRISMSPRNFARIFVRETGITPARYIDKLRIDTACRYLVDTRLSMKEIAELCGLGSPDNMRKVFLKYIKISPIEYRKNFGTAFGNN